MWLTEHDDAHRATLKSTDTIGLIKSIQGQIVNNILEGRNTPSGAVRELIKTWLGLGWLGWKTNIFLNRTFLLVNLKKTKW